MAAGVVGALAYTFCDSFWYSAVEGEVYATSAFFTALVFWAILKWEEQADKPGADRWIIFIFLHDGARHRRPPAEPADHPCHRDGLLFQTLQANHLGHHHRLYDRLRHHRHRTEIRDPIYHQGRTAFDIFFVNTLHLPFFVSASAPSSCCSLPHIDPGQSLGGPKKILLPEDWGLVGLLSCSWAIPPTSPR
jgi:hypothetical protein